MGEQVIKNARVYIGDYEMSGQHNTLDFGLDAEMLDRTVFNSTFRKRLSGLLSASFSHSGFFGTTDTDKEIYTRTGSTADVCTVCPNTGGEGARAFIHKAVWSEYSVGGTVGDLMSFSGAAAGDGAFVRGLVSVDQTFSNAATTGNSTVPLDLGTGKTGDALVASFHVTSWTSGNTATINIYASSSSGFGAETHMLEVAPSTAGSGSHFATTKASTTLQWYRGQWAISGSTGFSATIFGAVGRLNKQTT